MALKDKWVDKINEVDNVDANDINTVANAVIEIEKTLENNGGSGNDGENGATFTPSVSADGTLSWTNDKGLENPPSVNIKGADGDKGDKGDKGTTDFNQLQNKPSSEIWTFTLADGSTIVKEMYAETLTKTITGVVLTSPCATVTHNGRTYGGAFTFKANKGDIITVNTSNYHSGVVIIVNGVVVQEAPEKETITYEHTVTSDILIEHGSSDSASEVAKVIITDR